MRTFNGIVFALPLLFFSQAAAAMYCNQRLVRTGDSEYEVRAKCGPPTHAGAYPVTSSPAAGTTITTQVTRWAYDFGPRRLIHFLTFENGRLRRIERGPYGTVQAPGSPLKCRCRVAPGASEYLVVRSCGRPHQVTRRIERQTTNGRDRLPVESAAVVEDWTYDFGSNRLLRFFTFRNGRLVSQRTGSYGPRR